MAFDDDPTRVRAKLTDRGRGLVAAGATLTAAGLGLGFVDLVRVGAFALALPLLVLLGSRRRWSVLRLDRWVDGPPVTSGVPTTVTVRVQNQGSATTSVLLAEDHLSPGLAAGPTANPAGTANSVRFVCGPVPAESSRSFAYQVHPVRRGRHRIGPLVLTRRDPLGLADSVLPMPEQLEIVALPAVHRLAGSIGTLGIGSDGSMPAMTVLHGEDDTSIRGYHDGDDVRRIHWPVTAHRGQLMVRHEGRPTSRRALLLLDPLLLPIDPGPSQSALDWAAEAMASVAAHLATGGFALHLITPDSVASASADTPVSLARLVHALALVEPEAEPPAGDHSGRPALLSTLLELAARGGLLVTAAGDHNEPALHRLLDTRPPGGAGLLFVLDSSSFLDRPPGGRAGALADLARARGWTATAVTAGDDVGTGWARLLHVQASGGVVR